MVWYKIEMKNTVNNVFVLLFIIDAISGNVVSTSTVNSESTSGDNNKVIKQTPASSVSEKHPTDTDTTTVGGQEEVDRRGQVVRYISSTISKTINVTINASICDETDDIVIEVEPLPFRTMIILEKKVLMPKVTRCNWSVTVPAEHNLKMLSWSFPSITEQMYNYTVTLSTPTWTSPKTVLSSEDVFPLPVYNNLHPVAHLQYAGNNTNSYHFSASFTFTSERIPKLRIGNVNDTFYVMSPEFVTGGNGSMGAFGNEYNLSHTISVSENHSAVLSFSYFDLGLPTSDPHRNSDGFPASDPNCTSNKLTISKLDNKNETTIMCGKHHHLPIQMYRTSLHLTFHIHPQEDFTGFKLLYSVLPRSHEPVKLGDLYDCSVPHFHEFSPLLRCNLEVQCESSEDERECPYNTNKGCNAGTFSIGNKCYEVKVPDEYRASWIDAYYGCYQEQNNHCLATMATPTEWNRFKDILQEFGERIGDTRMFVGLKFVEMSTIAVRGLYDDVWKWTDGRAAFFKNVVNLNNVKPQCGYYSRGDRDTLQADRCDEKLDAVFVCQFDADVTTSVATAKETVTLSSIRNFTGTPTSSSPSSSSSFVSCQNNAELTHDFLICDFNAPCDVSDDVTSCRVGDLEVPLFECSKHGGRIPFTLVCDHRRDCPAHSDEEFCKFPPKCRNGMFPCRNLQCIEWDQKCDRMYQCLDESDETCAPPHYHTYMNAVPPPARVEMDGKGVHSIHPMNLSDACPETHFLCPGELAYCMPVFMRCNGFADCPGEEDEEGCDSYKCPGFYRCRNSYVCLHPKHVCDGVFQCLNKDDELLCNMTCPEGCRCQGLAFVCQQKIDLVNQPILIDVRYLRASGTGMTLTDFAHSYVSPSRYGGETSQFYYNLIRLELPRCGIKEIPAGLLFPNLIYLDLSYNEITEISMQVIEQYFSGLIYLSLSHNPLTTLVGPPSHSKQESDNNCHLRQIDLSFTYLPFYNGDVFWHCNQIENLNISFGKLQKINDNGFSTTPNLAILDLSNNADLGDSFPFNLLKNSKRLWSVHVDNFKLCCKATLPERLTENNCYAPQDELASCEDLISVSAYRFCLWFFASLSLCGNSGSFVTRFYLNRKKGSSNLGSFGIFVTNLSVADFFMGVYLVMIGLADAFYRGDYLWHDKTWKHSIQCNVAGFLSFMSSEVSAFIICLITLDRFLVLQFPFSRFHFNKKAALVACGCVWMAGISLAAVPLLPAMTHWQFYSQSGICIPLPFSGSSGFPGYSYSFSVMIVLNFVLFLLIAAGQVSIFYSIRANSMAAHKSGGMENRDATIARRLCTIVISDFLCWFPIGLLGLLSSQGVTIPRDLNVIVAIFVLPFNSALNPFLYTFNIVMEKRSKAAEAKLLKRLEMRNLTTMDTIVKTAMEEKGFKMTTATATAATNTDDYIYVRAISKESAVGYIQDWLRGSIVSHEDVVEACLVPLVNTDSVPCPHP